MKIYLSDKRKKYQIISLLLLSHKQEKVYRGPFYIFSDDFILFKDFFIKFMNSMSHTRTSLFILLSCRWFSEIWLEMTTFHTLIPIPILFYSSSLFSPFFVVIFFSSCIYQEHPSCSSPLFGLPLPLLSIHAADDPIIHIDTMPCRSGVVGVIENMVIVHDNIFLCLLLVIFIF